MPGTPRVPGPKQASPPADPAETPFSGPRSLRSPYEFRALILCLITAPLSIAIIGLIFKAVTISDMVLLVIAGMVYVSLSRGRLLGSSIRIHARQFPEVHAIVTSVAQRLGVAAPQIFVRDEFFVPMTAVGLGEPYALLISSQYLEHLRPGELRFLIAREMGHIAAGHTRLTSLLSASGRENFAIGLIFGAWLRRTEYTADRVGLLCVESMADAMGAISITTFHSIGRRVDVRVLAEQQHEIQNDQALRLGEWIGGMPYATHRIAALEQFEASPLCRYWRTEIDRPRELPAPEAAEPGEVVRKRDLAPNWRRAFALGIDLTVIALALHTAINFEVGPSHVKAGDSLPAWLGVLQAHGLNLGIPTAPATTILGFFAYSALLVALSGQTLGMMIMDLRVVDTHFGPAGVARTIWRYIIATFSLTSFVALVGIVMRVHPHDRLSGTRLVRGRTVPRAGADPNGEPPVPS